MADNNRQAGNNGKIDPSGDYFLFARDTPKIALRVPVLAVIACLQQSELATQSTTVASTRAITCGFPIPDQTLGFPDGFDPPTVWSLSIPCDREKS